MASILKKKSFLIIYWTLIILIFVGTRFFRLDTIPSGYHWDEAGMAYDAYCLETYGVDRHLNPYPLYLENYGGGQSVLYAYSCVLFFKLFGMSIWTVRLPAIINSFITLFFGFLLVKRINGNKFSTYLLPVILLLSPCLITTSRLGMDCFLLLGTFTLFVYLLVSAIDTRHDYLFILAGIAGGIALYSYALSYFILPTFLLVFVLLSFYWKKISFKNVMEIGIPLFIFAAPLICIQIINIFDLSEKVILGMTLTKLPSYRSGDFRAFTLAYLKLLPQSLIKGGNIPYMIPPKFSGFYMFTIPFFLIGFITCLVRSIRSIAKKQIEYSAIILMWMVILIILFCHLMPLSYRLNSFYLPICYFVSCGVDTICNILPSKAKKAAPFIPAAFLLMEILSFSLFFKYYYLGTYATEIHAQEYFDITVSEGLEYISLNPALAAKPTQMAENAVFCNLSNLANPFDSQSNSNDKYLDNELYKCSTLNEINPNFNYIVRDIYAEYAEELRNNGFSEITCKNYSLFFFED